MSRIGALYDKFLKKSPRQSRSRSVVEAALVAAARALHHGAPEELTIQEIAKNAGIGVGSLYDYFHDRESIMAAVTAKVTEDNLAAFEALLARTHDMPLRPAVELIVDHAFQTYAKDVRFLRAVLRIAHEIGLMPQLAENQTSFAASMAKALRERTDVSHENLDEKTYVLTHSLMGVMNAGLWSETEAIPRERARETLITMTVRLLSESSSPTDDRP